ncbi:MAG: sigma-54-dependent transcriptional regulator [Thioalkalivibrionaceae bacterium]
MTHASHSTSTSDVGKAVVLVVDDEPDLCELLAITLARMGLAADTAEDLAQARRRVDTRSYALCLTDLRLPDGDGLELVDYIQRQTPETPVAVITAHGSVDLAVQALKRGAFDFVSKPVDLGQLRTMVRQALKLSENRRLVTASRSSDSSLANGNIATVPDAGAAGNSHVTSARAPSTASRANVATASTPRATPSGSSAHDLEEAPDSQLIGESPIMQTLKRQIIKLARSQAPVCILGESGSGKERVAVEIHRLGPRSSGPFVPVNCGAIPAELMESEFFGHRKGAFSGALRDHDGLFRAANGGTLFLDEVADLPLTMQVKLLRAVQERAVKPVGALREEPVDVRILSATHKDLTHEIVAGRFRQDLYYRLNVIELRVPPLHERREDIPLLAKALLARILARSEAPLKLSDAALDALCRHRFPGNVRELENILERAAAMAENGVIDADDLALAPQGVMIRRHSDRATAPLSPPRSQKSDRVIRDSADRHSADGEDGPDDSTDLATSVPLRERRIPAAVADPGVNLDEQLADQERSTIEIALTRTAGNRTAAARLLGISFRQLRYRMKKLGMA